MTDRQASRIPGQGLSALFHKKLWEDEESLSKHTEGEIAARFVVRMIMTCLARTLK